MTKIKTSIFSSAVLAIGLSPVAAADTLTLSHGYPPSHDIVAHAIEPWMQCVEERTDNATSFNYFPSGQIASTKDSLDALNSGLAQVSTAAIGYVTDKMPLSGIAMLPNMGKSSVQAVSAFRSMINRDTPIAKEFKQNSVKPIFINMLGPYQVVSAVGPIKELGDFEGRKFRSGGGTMTLAINAVGGSAAEMGGGDAYVALQRGMLDAAILSLASLKPYSLEELVNAISTNGQFGVFPTLLVMDADTFNELESGTQQAVEECGLKIEKQLAEYIDEQSKRLQQEFSEGGIKIYEFSDQNWAEIAAELNSVSENYVERLEERGLPAQEVYKAYQAELRQ